MYTTYSADVHVSCWWHSDLRNSANVVIGFEIVCPPKNLFELASQLNLSRYLDLTVVHKALLQLNPVILTKVIY